jgi:hypothetical protein
LSQEPEELMAWEARSVNGQKQYHNDKSFMSPGSTVISPSTSPETISGEKRQKAVKQQQQRLLLLRHASKCPHEHVCPITPHCGQMKVLWKHIVACKMPDCKVLTCPSFSTYPYNTIPNIPTIPIPLLFLITNTSHKLYPCIS